MMTSSDGNIFRVTGPLCGEFTGPGEFPTQRPVTRSFDVCFDLRLNKRLSKHSWGWWFETLSWSLWRHHNASVRIRTWTRNNIHTKQWDVINRKCSNFNSCCNYLSQINHGAPWNNFARNAEVFNNWNVFKHTHLKLFPHLEKSNENKNT